MPVSGHWDDEKGALG
ncbi:MAG: hypothetical protein LBE46_02600 [Wolbachia pipientis]|nr:hypothetical protein [Wolbachia pipientis]